MRPALDAHNGTTAISNHVRVDSDYVFHELTRSICPVCRRIIDAKILLRDNQVFMSKRCPQCGPWRSSTRMPRLTCPTRNSTSPAQSR